MYISYLLGRKKYTKISFKKWNQKKEHWKQIFNTINFMNVSKRISYHYEFIQ